MKVRKAVLPVGGLGTRFLPATKAMPKEMLPVVDKPLIQYAVEEAWSAGIEQIIFVTGRGKVALEDHFDRSRDLERILEERHETERLDRIRRLTPESGTIMYTRQNEPLGLGHAIWSARTLVGNEPFAILLADDLIPPDQPLLQEMMTKFELCHASMVAMMEIPPQQTGSYGIIDLEANSGQFARIRGLVEKPAPEEAPSNMAIIGRYILTPRIFSFLENQHRGAGNEIQLTDAMQGLLTEEAIFGWRYEGIRYDCGNKAGFQMANIALALTQPELRRQLLPFLHEQLELWQ